MKKMKKMKDGKDAVCMKLAAGGAAKVRKGEATAEGKPIMIKKKGKKK